MFKNSSHQVMKAYVSQPGKKKKKKSKDYQLINTQTLI